MKHTRKGKTPARARYGRSPSSNPLTELEESDNELVGTLSQLQASEGRDSQASLRSQPLALTTSTAQT